MKLLVSLFEFNYFNSRILFSKNKNYLNGDFFLPEGALINKVSFSIKSMSEHTDILYIHQKDFKTFSLKDLELEVAIYHDAKMAEVTKFNGKKQFWLQNNYPNSSMLSKDEKFQRNLFLAEWLIFVRKQGLSNINFTFNSKNVFN